MGIGSKLQALLDAKDMKPGTLATKTGISRNTIYSIIQRDNANINLSMLQDIANALDVSIDYFFESPEEDEVSGKKNNSERPKYKSLGRLQEMGELSKEEDETIAKYIAFIKEQRSE